MKSGFAHFDHASRENFLAGMLALTMEVDEAVKELVARLVRSALRIDTATPLLSFGREARLDATDDDNYARVDLWFLFGPLDSPSYAFLEVKTHDNWTTEHVAEQVRDQASRSLARRPHPIRGSVLLGPERLCRRVVAHDSRVPALPWPTLIKELRALGPSSSLIPFTIRHLEDSMERPAGVDRELTLDQFEVLTATVACLRQFIVDCIHEVGGNVQGEPLYLTPADGTPRRGGGWAWHGLAVPFGLDGKRGRVGIYKYADVPAGEESARTTLWLEAYLGDGDSPRVAIAFTPAKLTTPELDACRAAFLADWRAATATGTQRGAVARPTHLGRP